MKADQEIHPALHRVRRRPQLRCQIEVHDLSAAALRQEPHEGFHRPGVMDPRDFAQVPMGELVLAQPGAGPGRPGASSGCADGRRAALAWARAPRFELIVQVQGTGHNPTGPAGAAGVDLEMGH